MKFHFLVFVSGIVLMLIVGAIPIDNGVEGDPEIECAASALNINFNTRNAFEGHVYVKGHFAEQSCRSDQGGRNVAGISLPFDQCGVQRTRSLNPRGVFVGTVVIISFHPQFETKVDRAYRVQCFYMEADKTVSTEMEVSMLTTAFQTQVVPMPICRYDILEGGPQGQPIRYALIGQQVYHKWTCDSETTDIFCITVHSCYVDDGAGNKVDLLDQNGCGLDKYLLRNLEYLTDLMAGQEANVFKYADKAQLFFQCQISITIKEPNTQCARPSCPEPGSGAGAASTGAAAAPAPVAAAATTAAATASTPAAGGVRRGRRPVRASTPLSESVGVVDVATDLQPLELNDNNSVEMRMLTSQAQPRRQSAARNGDHCLSYVSFGVLVSSMICIGSLSAIFLTIFCLRHSPE